MAATWLMRHPVPGVDFTCDGTWQVDTFRISTTSGWAGRGSLVPGSGYIQFCLIGPPSDPGDPDSAPSFMAIHQRFGGVR